MQLIEVIRQAMQAERDGKAKSCEADAEAIVERAGLPGHLVKYEALWSNSPFTEIPMIEWMCTDTHVGWYLILMDQMPIALRWQMARKSPPYIVWIEMRPGHNPAEDVRAWAIQNFDIDNSAEENILSLRENVDLTAMLELAEGPVKTIFDKENI